MTAPTAPRPLADLTGTIVLVGAGKMGAAMLEAWLALGLSPKQVVVIEPQPTSELTALDSCERYYPAFQFVIWAGKPARDALEAAMFETAGQA